MVIGCWLLILIVVKYLHSRPSLSYPPATSNPFPNAPTPTFYHVDIIEEDLLIQLLPPRGKPGPRGQCGRHFGFTNQNGGPPKPRTFIIQKTIARETSMSMNNVGSSAAKASQDKDQTQILGNHQPLQRRNS